MKKTITPFKADLILVIVAFLWGSSYVVTKNAISTIGPMYIVFYRFSIASVLCLIFYWKHLKNISKDEIKAGVLIGTLLAVGIIFSLNGVMYTTVSKNSFIVSINVVLVPFVYWAICKIKPTVMSISAVFLMALGLAFLTLDFSGSFEINKGDVLSLGCVLFYACHIVLSDVYAKKYDPVSINTVAMITAAVIGFIGLIIKGDINFNIPSQYIMNIIYLAVLPTFVCYTLQIVAQKYTVATHAAIIISLESVIATTLAIVFLKEILTLNMIIGCVIIFISVLTSEIGDIVLAGFKQKYFLKHEEINNLQTDFEE